MDNTDWDERWRAQVAEQRAAEQRARLQGRAPGAGRATAHAGRFTCWGDAVVTCLIGLVVSYIATFVFVLGTLTLVVANAAGGDDMSTGRMVALAVFPIVLGLAVGVAGQTAYLRHRGLAPVWAAPIAAVTAGEVMSWLASSVLGPSLAFGWVVMGLVEIVVLASMLRPERRGR